MRTALICSLALSLCSCGGKPAPAMTVAEVSHSGLTLYLEEDGSAVLRFAGDACFSFTGRATVDGRALTQKETGNFYTGVELGGTYQVCGYPSWTVPAPLPDEAVTEFVVSDSTGQVDYGVAHLGGTHGFVAPASPLALHWGQPVTLEWAPGTDDLSPAELNVSLHQGALALDIEGLDPSPTVDGGNLYTFQVIDAPSDGGTDIENGSLVITPLSINPGTDHCGGTFCLVDIDFMPPAQTIPATVN